MARIVKVFDGNESVPSKVWEIDDNSVVFVMHNKKGTATPTASFEAYPSMEMIIKKDMGGGRTTPAEGFAFAVANFILDEKKRVNPHMKHMTRRRKIIL